jgi:hypothetical protein
MIFAMILLADVQADFWGRYGAGLIALVGFSLHSVVLYGAAQKLAGKHEEQRKNDDMWRANHEAQANLRDIAIAALQLASAGSAATMKGVQDQLALIQTELQQLRNRSAIAPPRVSS